MYQYMFLNHLWLRFLIIIYLVCAYFLQLQNQKLKNCEDYFKYKLLDPVAGL